MHRNLFPDGLPEFGNEPTDEEVLKLTAIEASLGIESLRAVKELKEGWKQQGELRLAPLHDGMQNGEGLTRKTS